MKGFYFDYQILGVENISIEERRVREGLQRNLSAVEILREMSKRHGLQRTATREKVTQMS